jgi:hypothetical protein
MSVFFTRRGEPPKFNKLASDLEIGESVFLTFNNTPTEFIVIHQGNPNSSMYDESCNGTWLLLKDCYIQQLWDNSTINDYRNSHVHGYLNDEFLDKFDVNTQLIIKQVKIPYVRNVENSAVSKGTNGLSTKVFLLSIYEVGVTSKISSYTPLVDGSVLSYFSDPNNAVARRIAYYNGKATPWWLRSPYNGSTIQSLNISNDGYGATGYVTDSYGIRPTLIIPLDAKFDPDTNSII